jgi:hypothetical protein
MKQAILECIYIGKQKVVEFLKLKKSFRKTVVSALTRKVAEEISSLLSQYRTGSPLSSFDITHNPPPLAYHSCSLIPCLSLFFFFRSSFPFLFCFYNKKNESERKIEQRARESEIERENDIEREKERERESVREKSRERERERERELRSRERK